MSVFRATCTTVQRHNGTTGTIGTYVSYTSEGPNEPWVQRPLEP